MSLPTCNPCADVPICLEDLEKYSLQDDLYGYVLTCPPGMYCGGPSTLFLECCDGTTMSQTFPLGITLARRNALINDLVAKCARRLLFCDSFDPYQPPLVPPGDDIQYFYSAPASCTVYCPDGTPFTYTVPAGVFISRSLADATAAAKQLACLRAPEFRICLGPFNACWCADTYRSAIIAIDSAHPPFKVSVISGAFPAGLSLTTQGKSVVIAGAATAPGNYAFGLQVTDPFGNTARRTYTMSVIEITTASLDPCSVGVPYSFQLQAAGGSGNYAWRISSGSLPDGLTLDISGLISGTPTQVGAAPITFVVIDTTCEAVTASFFRPRAVLNTVGTTTLKIKRGYPVYTGSDTTLYKKITWVGFIEQRATAAGQYCGGARYVYSGSTEINAFGTFIEHHHKNRYSNCIRPVYPEVGGFISELLGTSQVTRLVGYCWGLDPNSCGFCSTNSDDWAFEADFQTGDPEDPPLQMFTEANGFTRTPTTFDYFGTKSDTLSILGVNNLPSNQVAITAIGDYTATLSEPYTAADAEASKQTITSTLGIAENKPDYLRAAGQQFLTLVYSRETTVAFTINCTNLVPNAFYRVLYEIIDSDGTITPVSQDFQASNRTQQITGTLGLPAANHSQKIRNLSIQMI